METLQKWAKVAIMRRNMRKMAQQLKIKNTHKPDFVEGLLANDKKILFSDEEMAYLLSP